jgi:cytidine deaminase
VSRSERELLERAREAAASAYAPYSNFRVGAAVRTRDGQIFVGANVENASFPLGLCAERAALAAAVSAGYRPGDFELLAVTATPCGACRQWLVELGVVDVVYSGPSGDTVLRKPTQLLPDSFELEGPA